MYVPSFMYICMLLLMYASVLDVLSSVLDLSCV